MSDTSGGPGWWQASDTKWYPPHLQPGPMPPPPLPGPPVKRGMSGGTVAAIVIGSVVAVVLLLVGAVTLLGKSAETSFDAVGCIGPCDTSAPGVGTFPTVPTAQPGYSVYHGVGFAILLPSNATTTGLGPAELDSFANSDLAKSSPAMQAELAQLRSLPATAGKFFAASPAGVTVGLFQTEVEIPLDTAAVQQAIGDPLVAAGATNVTVSQVTLANGEAIELTYDNTVTVAGGGTASFHGAQFYEPVAGHTWLLNISEPSPVADPAVIDTIADSFVVLT